MKHYFSAILFALSFVFPLSAKGMMTEDKEKPSTHVTPQLSEDIVSLIIEKTIDQGSSYSKTKDIGKLMLTNKTFAKILYRLPVSLAFENFSNRDKIKTLPTGFSNIVFLNLNHCRKFTDETLIPLKNFVSIKTLELGWSKMDGSALKSIQHLPNLTSLKLWGCDYLQNKGVSYLQALTQLVFLSLAHCPSITDEGLLHISGLTNLEALELHNYRNITDGGLQHLSKLIQLTTLGFYGNENITDSGMIHLTGLTRLTYLSLERCDEVSLDGCDLLFRSIPDMKIKIDRDHCLVMKNGEITEIKF